MKTLIISILIFCVNFSYAQDYWYYPYGKDRKWGIVRSDKKLILEPLYDALSFFAKSSDGSSIYSIVQRFGQYGVINGKGDLIIPTEWTYMRADWLCDDFVIVYKNGKYGLQSIIDGSMPFKAEYSEIREFKGYVTGVAIMQKDGLFGCINSKGKVIAPAMYKSISYLDQEADDPLIELEKTDGSKIIIDAFGELVEQSSVNTDVDDFSIFDAPVLGMDEKPFTHVRYSPVSMNGENCFVFNLISKKEDDVDKAKDTICGYENIATAGIDPFNPELELQYVVVENNAKMGLINNKGVETIPCEYDMISNEEQYFNLRKGRLYGLADVDGNLVLNAKYTFLREYYCSVKKFNNRFYKLHTQNGYVVFANKQGEVFLPEGL